jgi:exodeoxyribonuclease VII large subunit
LLTQTLEFERRMLNCFTKGLKDRQRHLAQLARVLPRAESLFAAPRQRLDTAADKLRHGLARNRQIHEVRFNRTAARLRDQVLRDRIVIAGQRGATLWDRAKLAQSVRLAQKTQKLQGLFRLLESVSHKSVLERGFALVRGEDGSVRRRASAVKAGEALRLTFADGEKSAVAEGGSPRLKAKKPADQGSLF